MAPRRKLTDPEPGYPSAGRPLKDPLKKVGTPARALITDPLADVLVEIAQKRGIPILRRGRIPGDVVRLGLAMLIKHDGLWTPEVEEDPTWDNLKGLGQL